MASFPTHISFGIALGILAALTLISTQTISDPTSAFFLFTAVTLGSILPDMDSDSGLPFHITFGSLSITTAGLIAMQLYNNTQLRPLEIAAWASGAALFVWVICGGIFKHLTHHRGIIHSLPAAALSGLITFFITQYISKNDATNFLLALGVAAGFLLHLILDEIYAAVNFHGIPFIPNKAFGSALKIASKSLTTNIIVYALIALLLIGNTQHLIELFNGLAHNFQK